MRYEFWHHAKPARWGLAILVALGAGAVWFAHSTGHADLSNGSVPPTLQIQSTSFAGGAQMPSRLTCDGGNLSPGITFPKAPAGTQSFVLIMDDLDTPFGIVHWLAYDIPPSTHEFAEAASTKSILPAPVAEGRNDFGNLRYDGPCPPSGRHRYRISLYAIDVALTLQAGATKASLATAVNGHIRARGQIFGFYSREGH